MSEYFTLGKDLDDVFKLRITSKAPDVGYSINGVDISNRYEKTANDWDQINYDTNIKTPSQIFSGRYRDLRYVFQSSNAYFIKATLYTVPETYKKYQDLNDGKVNIYIETEYLKAVGGNYKLTFKDDNTRVTTITRSTGTASIFYQYTGFPSGNHTITVTDANSSASGSVQVNVAYSSPSRGPYYIT